MRNNHNNSAPVQIVTGVIVAVAAVTVLIILGRVGAHGKATSPAVSSQTPPSASIPTSAPMNLPGSAIHFSGTEEGAVDAPVTIVVYSDFQCHYCQDFALTTSQREKPYANIQVSELLLKGHYTDQNSTIDEPEGAGVKKGTK